MVNKTGLEYRYATSSNRLTVATGRDLKVFSGLNFRGLDCRLGLCLSTFHSPPLGFFFQFFHSGSNIEFHDNYRNPNENPRKGESLAKGPRK